MILGEWAYGVTEPSREGRVSLRMMLQKTQMIIELLNQIDFGAGPALKFNSYSFIVCYHFIT